MKSHSNLAGVGIDLISLRRVRRLLKEHSPRTIRLFFSPVEIKKRDRISPLGFAKMFTAKESFFKTLGDAQSGPEGFRKVTVTLDGRDCFEAASGSGGAAKRARGSFFQCGDFVGAQVLRWK